MDTELLFKELSYKIVGLAMQAHTELGYGYLEKVYENALMVLFEENGIPAVQQARLDIKFHGHVIGTYSADILVDEKIIIELKSQNWIIGANKAQALNYPRATGLRLAILLNFSQSRLEHERVVL